MDMYGARGQNGFANIRLGAKMESGNGGSTDSGDEGIGEATTQRRSGDTSREPQDVHGAMAGDASGVEQGGAMWDRKSVGASRDVLGKSSRPSDGTGWDRVCAN